MSRQSSVCFVLLWIMMIFTYLLALRQANQAPSRFRKPFDRYTVRDVMEQAAPIIQAIRERRAADTSHTYACWHIMLKRPGWRAHITLDADTGILMYADFIPIR